MADQLQFDSDITVQMAQTEGNFLLRLHGPKPF